MKPKQWIYYMLLGLLVWVVPQSTSAQNQPGEPLSPWTQGYLDIHFINAGKGEAAFYVLPDGTTLLVDAGATSRPKPRVTDPKPDSSRTPGAWISRYILNVMDGLGRKKIDYMMISHFHDDHMGTVVQGSPLSRSGAFKLAGVTEVGENIPVGMILDRGWPDYAWPTPAKGADMDNYIRFVKWSAENKGTKVERFLAGAGDQIKLLRQPGKYADFGIRNVAVNGEVWTGFGNNSRNHFPPLESLDKRDYPSENMCSIAFRLSYGKFDFYSGGDLVSGPAGQWQDIETPVGMVTGPVEVCKANHHSHIDAMGASFLQAVRPRVHIIQAWAPSHPGSIVLSRMFNQGIYPGPRDIFSTNVMRETHVVIGDGIDRMKSRQGHIVVRVHPGGDHFMIYTVDDSSESHKITAIHGPYTSN